MERYFTYSEEDKVKAFFLKNPTFRRLIYNELEAAELLLLLLAIAILRSAGVQEFRSVGVQTIVRSQRPAVTIMTR